MGIMDETLEKSIDKLKAHSFIKKPNDIDDETLVEMYTSMVLLRHFDRTSVQLQRAGRIGTYPPLEGQEACQVASVMGLRHQDFIFPTYRDYGAMMKHGVPMKNILLYWNGRVEGCMIPKDVSVFPIAVPIATQLPHAAGLAWAAKLRGLDQISLAFFGDGASSEGDFHEALNFAGVFRLPVIYFCQNNQYAISVPFARQTATATIAEKAAAYGLPGVRVDGSNPLEIYRVVREAVSRAASGGGATLIEALTYRYGAHTTSDDPRKYRDEAEGEVWKQRDPIRMLGSALRDWGLWDDAQDDTWKASVERQVAEAIVEMESVPPVCPDDLFEHVYHTLTPRLQRQRSALAAELESLGTVMHRG